MSHQEILSWIDADGTAWPFHDHGIYTTWDDQSGYTGLQWGSKRIARRTVAGQPGTVLDLVEDHTRTLSLPVLLEADTVDGFRGFMEQWAYRMDPTRGPGKLVLAIPGVTARYINCLCVAGFDFTESASLHSPRSQLSVLEFEADDPHFVDVFPSSETWAVGGGAATWFGHDWFPLNLSGGDLVLGEHTFTVDGTKRVFPQWTINGPAEVITATHVGLDRTWVWDGTLLTGEQLVIDRGSTTGTVLLDGVSAFDDLTAWDLWPLIPGDNTVNVTVTGSAAGTRVKLVWHNRWNGPA